MGSTFKQHCIALRKAGHTLPEICAITGRKKTTVYFHIRDIALPQERLDNIKNERCQRLHNYILRHRKGKSTNGRHPNDFETWNERLVSLVSHLVFDGTIAQSGCMYYNRSAALLQHVRASMSTVYPYPPVEITESSGVVRLCWYNVELAAVIRDKADELLATIDGMRKELQRVFLQALFDDEGCVTYSAARSERRVRAYQHNLQLLELAQLMLTNFGIESKIDGKQVELVISRKHNLIRFRDEINFSPGVRVNGKRRNSVWKQSLEKRDILDHAIASYLPFGTPGVTHV